MLDKTHNMSLGILLLMAMLFISYIVGAPAHSSPEKDTAHTNLQQHFSSPVFKLPLASKKENRAQAQVTQVTKKTSPQIQAEAVLVWDREKEEVLYANNASTTRPIASITKLVTAAVVLQEASLKEEVTISERAILQEGNAGQLRSGEKINVEGLLHIMLLESSNDAAFALAKHITSTSTNATTTSFAALMNNTARSFGMQNSHFADPAGLADDEAYSTAHDIALLLENLRENPLYAPLWQILQKPQAVVYSHDRSITHTLQNNNPFIGELAGSVGGKTGYTQGAGESLVLVTKRPHDKKEILYVVLGSTDRFSDMRKLINWAANSFTW